MLVRLLKSDDKEQFLDLRKKNLREFGYKKIPLRKLEEEFNGFLNRKEAIALVVDDGKIKGYIICTVMKNAWQRSCYIDDIFVLREERRKGVGGILLREIMKIAKKKKIKRFRLGVEVKNKKARNLYEKFGFKITHYEMFLRTN